MGKNYLSSWFLFLPTLFKYLAPKIWADNQQKQEFAFIAHSSNHTQIEETEEPLRIQTYRHRSTVGTLLVMVLNTVFTSG